MALKGNLETFFLTSILQLLHNDRKTGTLQVKNGDDWVNVFIEDGSIVYAMASNVEARLGSLLINREIITLEQLQECLDLGKEKKMALGKAVVEKGYLSIDQLKGFIHNQIEEIIYNLFLWDSGDFEYKDAKIDLSRVVAAKLDIMEVILEVSRRIDEMSILEKQIPNDQLVFKISNKVRDKEEIKLQANEWSVLALINGKCPVQKLVDESEIGKFQVYKALYSLSSSGLIEKIAALQLQKQDQPGEIKKGEDHSAVIIGYNNILQVIFRNLEEEIGKQTLVLFEECIPEALPGQKDLFKNFHPNNPPSANICALHDNLKIFKNLKNEQVFLAESFNRFILNILNRVPGILGVSPTKDMLEEVGNILPYISKHLEGIKAPSNIADDIKKITANVEEQIDEKEKRKSGGILSMFKKT